MEKFKIFIQLTRLNKPIGFLLLFWPCLWGLTLANYQNQNNYFLAPSPYDNYQSIQLYCLAPPRIFQKENFGAWKTFWYPSPASSKFWDGLDFSGELALCVSTFRTGSFTLRSRFGKWTNHWALRSLITVQE